MKEHLISLKTSQLAKKKGFNWKCFNSYNLKGEIFGRDLTELVQHQNETIFKAPRQSLLQKWLRDEYDIQIIVISNSLGHYFVDYRYGDQRIDNEQDLVLLSGEISDSYEEALEKGLYKSLKLICL